MSVIVGNSSDVDALVSIILQHGECSTVQIALKNVKVEEQIVMALAMVSNGQFCFWLSELLVVVVDPCTLASYLRAISCTSEVLSHVLNVLKCIEMQQSKGELVLFER